MRADALPRARRARRSCASQAGNVNTGAFDPLARRSCARRTRRAPGCTWTARSACGPRRRRRARRSLHGMRARRLVGHRRAQVAQRALRQRPRVRARRARAARGDGDHRRLPADRGAARNPSRLHARAVAPRARRRGLGGAALARPRGRRRAGRAQLPPGARASPRARARRATRCSTRWCSTRCWCRSATPSTTRPRDRGDPGATARAGAAARCGRAARRCASASPPGRRPRRTWSGASRR